VSAELILAALLAAAAVAVVSIPFLRADEPPEETAPPDRELAAAEERDRALAALKELEFDHRTGKVTDEEYRAQVVALRREAAAALRAAGPPRRNGAQLSEQAAEHRPEQPFSASSPHAGRSDR
jgi:hypothetical protein